MVEVEKSSYGSSTTQFKFSDVDIDELSHLFVTYQERNEMLEEEESDIEKRERYERSLTVSYHLDGIKKVGYELSKDIDDGEIVHENDTPAPIYHDQPDIDPEVSKLLRERLPSHMTDLLPE